MSPTSYQLLYPAIFKVLDYYSQVAIKMQALSFAVWNYQMLMKGLMSFSGNLSKASG